MSAKYKSPRKAIPIRIEKAVLAKSRRRCTLCFGLHGDVTEKRGQIAHLDGNRNNNAESNLAWMCLDHHSLFDSKTKQHKNYTIPEVKEYRRRLYKELRLAAQRSSHRVRGSSSSRPKKAERNTKVTYSPVATGKDISQTINSHNTIAFAPAADQHGCDFWLSFRPEGSRFLAIQNSGAEPGFDVVVRIPADGSGYAFDPINRLNNDRQWVMCFWKRDAVKLQWMRRVIAEAVMRATDNNGVAPKSIPVLITYRTRQQRGCEQQLEIRLPLHDGIQFALPESLETKLRSDQQEGEEAPPHISAKSNATTGTPSELTMTRIVDRGSGEERRQVWEQSPDIVLEWFAGTSGKRDKGTFRNIGKRSGFSIKTENFSWPELQFTFPVQINAIHPDKEVTVELPVVEKTGPGSSLVGSLDSFMRDPKFKERDDLKLTITFSDSEGHSFEREFVFRAGPGGNFGPRVITSLGPLHQGEPESMEPKAPRGLSAKRWDVFISHASEDKEKVARPLADALKKRGFLVWYDDFTLKLGDSLRESIDRGLAESRFGVVILSKHFFAKRWPSKELNGLTAIEIRGEKVILPVWHGVTHDDVLQYSPTLADRKAVNTGEGLDRVVADIEEVLNPPMTEDLHEQLDEAEETLQEYRCPCCGSPLSTRSSVPLSEHDDGTYEDFECGYAHIDGYMQCPCPSDSKFPKLDDYDFIYKELQGDSNWRWQCFASGKTKEARMLSLMSGSGRTKEEAREQVEKWYREYAKPWKKR